MKIRDLLEAASGGATGSGAIATVTNPNGKKPSEVGSLFGGTYGEAQKPKTKKPKVIKR
jgi:hypothetical protein